MYAKRIIIGGLPRSGTTLFRYILDASNRVICGPETGFFRRPIAEQKKRIARVANRLKRAFDINEEVLKHIVLSHDNSVRAFDAIVTSYMDRLCLDKDMWAEKTPRNCFSYNWLIEEDPDIYFISLIRDGRDVVTSVLDGEESYHCSIDRYIETLDAIYDFDTYAHRHLIVRYEDMVLHPKEKLREVFDYLGLPFSVEVLERYRIPCSTRDAAKVRQPKVSSPITSRWVGRWKQNEHTRRIEEFMENERAVAWLEGTGYDLLE